MSYALIMRTPRRIIYTKYGNFGYRYPIKLIQIQNLGKFRYLDNFIYKVIYLLETFYINW